MMSASWNKESHIPGMYTRKNLVIIGDSLWYSSPHKSYDRNGENGMTEYSIKSRRFIQTIPYPSGIKPKQHCCCVVKNIIYIIDGVNQVIIAFNPYSNKFTKKQKIPKIGRFPNAVATSNMIRIFHGYANTQYDIVYDTVNDSIKIHQIQHNNIECAAEVLHQNKIVCIGGWDDNIAGCSNKVRIGKALDKNEAIKWKEKKCWELPIGLQFSGCVLYSHYVLLFGGEIATEEGCDHVYVLDLNEDKKWLKLRHVTCPIAGYYVAAITPDNEVHLFLGKNTDHIRGHYTMKISKILGSRFSVENDEESKCSECDGLRAKNESLQKLINDLINDKETTESKSKQDSSKLIKEKNECMAKYQQSQRDNDTLESHLAQVENDKNQEIQRLSQQLKQQQQQIMALNVSLKEAQEKEMALSEECKEAKIELLAVRKELKEMKRKNIDPKRFMDWTGDEFVDWICSLDEGKYMQYEDRLREAFENEAIDGSAIPDIEKNDWKGWGVQIFKDRTNIHKHAQALKNQNVNDNNDNVAPAYNLNYNEGGDKTEYH